MSEERLKTSIKILPSVWKLAKIEAIKRDMDVSVFVEKAIEEFIKKSK